MSHISRGIFHHTEKNVSYVLCHVFVHVREIPLTGRPRSSINYLENNSR